MFVGKEEDEEILIESKLKSIRIKSHLAQFEFEGFYV